MNLRDHHPFRSMEARQRYLQVYDRIAKRWPSGSETRTVSTFLGETLVRTSGPASAPALVLLPGINATSLMWLDNVARLSQSYRVFAVDGVYDFGRSVPKRDPRNADELVEWLDELLVALGITETLNLVGASYGGWLTCQYALRLPHRLAKAVILAPAGAIEPIGMSFIWRALLCMVPHPVFMKRMAHWLSSDSLAKDDHCRGRVQDMIDLGYWGIRSFKKRETVHPLPLTDEQWGSLEVPMLCMIGENERLYRCEDAMRHLGRAAPRIATKVIPGAGHDLYIAQANMVNESVLEFLGR